MKNILEQEKKIHEVQSVLSRDLQIDWKEDSKSENSKSSPEGQDVSPLQSRGSTRTFDDVSKNLDLKGLKL